MKGKLYRFAMVLSLCITLLIVCTPISYGQFFKKLKKTVKELVVTPPDEAAVDHPASGTNVQTSKKIAKTAALTKDPNITLQDPKAHGIEVVAAITIDFKDQYVCMQYVNIANHEGQVVATIPIGHFVEKEALSEAGEGSDKDPVAIYANNAVASNTTIGDLRKASELAAAHKWYDYPWSTELVRNSKKEADLYVKKGEGPGGLYSSIQFNGKKYGPYMIIGDFLVSRDRHRFYAQISPDMKAGEKGSYSILGMDGKIRVLPTGGDIIANLDFTSCAVLVTTSAIVLNDALHTENEDKSAALQKQAMEINLNAPNKGNVYFLNGKNLEGVLLSDGWLDNSGNNFFATISEKSSGFEKGTYLNGKKISDQSVQISRGWANSQGTAWAIEVINYSDAGASQLIFSDGSIITGAKDVHPLLINGTYYMVWYNYNHQYGDQLKVYKKALL